MTDLVEETAALSALEPVGSPAGTGEPLAAVLEALRLAAVRVLASTPRAPHRLRVEAAGVAVELSWPEPAGRLAPLGAGAGVPHDDVLALLAAARVPGADGHGALDNGKSDGHAVPRPRAVAVEAEAHCVCAPTVGTFYRSPEPGAKPFVEVGDLVTVGQQLAIVEAMKLMIPVEADRAGRVREILATDATAVEYGERLIAIASD